MLGGGLAVLQAPLFDGLSLDPFASLEHGGAHIRVDGSKPDESRRQSE
jgi:hypothetical protein